MDFDNNGFLDFIMTSGKLSFAHVYNGKISWRHVFTLGYFLEATTVTPTKTSLKNIPLFYLC